MWLDSVATIDIGQLLNSLVKKISAKEGIANNAALGKGRQGQAY